jgi:ApaG protein
MVRRRNGRFAVKTMRPLGIPQHDPIGPDRLALWTVARRAGTRFTRAVPLLSNREHALDTRFAALSFGEPVSASPENAPPHLIAPHSDVLRTGMYRAVTRGIEVLVKPRFLPERSSLDKSYYFWAYTIEITNRGMDTVQLKTRYWRITDAFGRVQEVRGAGVVGEEPILKPGTMFEYTSGVPLPTPSGFMVGTYGMVSAKGDEFDIDIPAFSLDGPESRRTLN